jgi:hypothetical protein
VMGDPDRGPRLDMMCHVRVGAPSSQVHSRVRMRLRAVEHVRLLGRAVAVRRRGGSLGRRGDQPLPLSAVTAA